MTYNETEMLIQKYLNGETSAEEERLLALEVSRDDAPEDWKIIAGMLGELTVDEALFDLVMAERSQKPRIMKLWPWVAAACIAALLIAFLGPPKDNMSTLPQTAKNAIEQERSDAPIDPEECEQTPPKDKTEPQNKVAEVKSVMPHSAISENVEPKVENPHHIVEKTQPTHKTKHQVNVSNVIAKASHEIGAGQVAKQENSVRELMKVEEDDIVPYEDSQMQFAEQARVLRERGNRVIQRVSLNSTLPPINNSTIYL